jgi:galactosamine-6-phosphate isomerase
MNVLIADDHEALSQLAAELLLTTVIAKPTAQLCLVGGETPVRTYAVVVERLRAAHISHHGVRICGLNEWCNLPNGDPATMASYLAKHVLTPLGMPPSQFTGFSSDAADWDAECAKMRTHLERQPIDFCLLGLGLNGHLALNEPGDSLAPSVHLAELSESTQRHSMLEGVENAPEYGLTLGMGDLMHARQVVLLVSGARKAEMMRRLMMRDISTSFPASLLWLHPGAICLCDRAAYGLCG